MAIPHVYCAFLGGECGCNDPKTVFLYFRPTHENSQRVLAHPFLEHARMKVPLIRDWRGSEEDGTHVLCGVI